MKLAVFLSALLMRDGAVLIPSALAAESKSAIHPVAFGLDIEVPFISWFRCKHQFGTHVIAAATKEICNSR